MLSLLLDTIHIGEREKEGTGAGPGGVGGEGKEILESHDTGVYFRKLINYLLEEIFCKKNAVKTFYDTSHTHTHLIYLKTNYSSVG